MASLDKMVFRGVRSFDDKEIHMIQFYTPLTIIVGHNGSGKTTIIECLKYATTGDMPPNTKGGAFIHDPSMAISNEVKAQVRLRFYNTNKVRMSCVRNVQVSKKKTGGLTLKTLESLLSVDDPNKASNKRTSLSTKCAELDEEIPRLLGVSKAVLDNVIFCHQEDSNWPLSEGSNLKKKFDDIFEATRYSKALDNIKSLRKERTINLKIGKAELEGLKTDKERADNVRNKAVKLQETLAEREDTLSSLNKEIDEITSTNKKLYDTAVRYRETIQKAETLEEKRALHRGNIENLKMTMTELKESESELNDRKDSFRSHLQSQKTRQETMKRKIEERKVEISHIDSKVYKKLSEKGALENDKSNHEIAIRQREELIRDISKRLGIKGYSNEGLSEAQIEQFTERIEEDLRKVRKEFDLLRERNQEEESENNIRYQDLRSSLRGLEASRTTFADNLKRVKARVKSLQQEVDDMSITTLDIETAQKEHADLAAQGEAMLKAQADADYEGKIRGKNEELRSKDERREDLTSELNSLNRQSDFRAKMDVKRRSAEQKEAEAKALYERHQDAIRRAVGRTLKAEEAEGGMADAINAKEKELSSLERAEQESSKSLQHTESSLTFARKQLKEKEAQVLTFHKEIQSVLQDGEDSYESLSAAIADAEGEVNGIRDSILMLQNAGRLFEGALKHGQEKHSCMVCGRGIDKTEEDKVLAFMREKYRKSQPDMLKEEQQNLESWQTTLNEYVALKPKEAQMNEIKSNEMPRIKSQVEKEEAKLNDLKGEAEEKSSAVEVCKGQLREFGNLRRVANDIGRILKEVTALREEAAGLEKDLASSGSTRTGDEVQREIDDLADGIKRIKRELQTLQQDRETTRSQISNHERNLHRIEMALAQKKQEYSRREELVKRLDELTKEQEETQQSLVDLQRKLDESAEPIKKAREALELGKAKASKEETEANEKVTHLTDLAKRLDGCEIAVQSYIRKRGAQKLKDCEDALEDLDQQVKEVQAEVSRVEKDVMQIEKDLNESRATERNIHDNLRYIQLNRDIKQIDQELNSLDLEESNKLNKVWTEKYNASKRLENELNGKAQHIGGEIASLKSQKKARDMELKEEYKNVDKKFTTKLVEVKTSELANNDLEIYQKALHSAIMRFHSIKMQEINDNLSVLWGETYQGTDIDTIKIKADSEGTGARSTYNYRVVMIKDSVEMDMRGRCSAGQKCLASILIRLALADSFSANCGIMALDEPTTNLDMETVAALADSLSKLIAERRGQSNFQLIVITHDENFLSNLSQKTGIEWYFRVGREQIDHRQRSYVSRERVSGAP